MAFTMTFSIQRSGMMKTNSGGYSSGQHLAIDEGLLISNQTVVIFLFSKLRC
jgi:hypothetical protein